MGQVKIKEYFPEYVATLRRVAAYLEQVIKDQKYTVRIY